MRVEKGSHNASCISQKPKHGVSVVYTILLAYSCGMQNNLFNDLYHSLRVKSYVSYKYDYQTMCIWVEFELITEF